MVAPVQSTKTIEIFVCFSQKDEKLQQEFINHLSALRSDTVTIQTAQKISGGSDYDNEMKTRLNSANIILLLISANFIYSINSNNEEEKEQWGTYVEFAMQRSQAPEVRVIPILLQSCLWDKMSFSHLKAFPSSNDFIGNSEDKDRAKAFTEVVTNISEVIEEIRKGEKKISDNQQNLDTKKLPQKIREWNKHIGWRNIRTMFFTSVGLTVFVILLRFSGVLQASEFWFFDQMMRFQSPDSKPDDRLLVIGVTKEDIKNQEGIKRGSLTDKTLLTLLETLLHNPHNQPRTIGLGIHRDFETVPAKIKEFSNPENKKLSDLLKQESRIIGLCSVGDSTQDNDGVNPPPEIPGERLGFSDFLDIEEPIRRQILSIETPKESPCWSSEKKPVPVSNAFSLKLVEHYLGKRYEEVKDGSPQLGDTTFELLNNQYRGGYSPLTDLSGHQLLLNYRRVCLESNKYDCSPKFVAKKVTLKEVFQTGVMERYDLKNKIVLIGVTDNSYGVPRSTPFSPEDNQKIPEIIMQAQMVSQILNAVIDKRPLLHVWFVWYEILWVLFWSLFGGTIALLHFSKIPWLRLSTGGLVISGGIAFIGLYCSCLILFITPVKRWVPFVPPALTFVGSGGVVLYLGYKPQKSKSS